MTVMSVECSKRFHGSGGVGPFTWSTWRFLSNADLWVYRIANPNEADPTRETRVILGPGDYVVTGAGSYTGGRLTLSSPLVNGHDLLVLRKTVPLQRVSIRNQGGSFRPSVHEDVFDRLTMMIQDRDLSISTAATDIEVLKLLLPIVAGLQAGVAAAVYERAAVNGPVLLPAGGSVVVSIPLTDETGDPLVIQPSVGGQTIWGGATYELSGAGATAMFILIGTDWRRVG